jgi:hypothetical protein
MNIGEISGSHGDEYEGVFWNVAPCSLVEVYRRFRGACCLRHQGMRVIFLMNIFSFYICCNNMGMKMVSHI